LNNNKSINSSSLKKCLEECGIVSGDTILVHSNLFVMGPVQGNNILETYFNAIKDVLGSDGTIAVPSYFYEYGRWATPFDIKQSPVSKELGAFSNYVNELKESFRSQNPLTAISAIGTNAEFICCSGAGSSFGIDTPWDQLIKCNAKMVFIGIDLVAMTFIHFVEYMVGVPHIYNKYYRIPVLMDGNKTDNPISAQVRYRDFDINYDLKKLTPDFEKAGLIKTVSLGRGKIRVVSFKSAFYFLKEQLKKDFFYLLKSPPKFIQGEIPMDSPTGPRKPET